MSTCGRYADVFNLSKTSTAYLMLKKFGDSDYAGPGCGDFAKVASNFLSKDSNARAGKSDQTLTLRVLNTYLNELSTLHVSAKLKAPEKKIRRKVIFTEMIQRTSAEEHEWLVPCPGQCAPCPHLLPHSPRPPASHVSALPRCALQLRPARAPAWCSRLPFLPVAGR